MTDMTAASKLEPLTFDFFVCESVLVRVLSLGKMKSIYKRQCTQYPMMAALKYTHMFANKSTEMGTMTFLLLIEQFIF